MKEIERPPRRREEASSSFIRISSFQAVLFTLLRCCLLHGAIFVWHVSIRDSPLERERRIYIRILLHDSPLLIRRRTGIFRNQRLATSGLHVTTCVYFCGGSRRVLRDRDLQLRQICQTSARRLRFLCRRRRSTRFSFRIPFRRGVVDVVALLRQVFFFIAMVVHHC